MKPITRDDTVHGVEYVTLAEVNAAREADREAMRMALEAALHVTDCCNRNEYGDIVLPGSLYNPEHLDAAIKALEQRVGES